MPSSIGSSFAPTRKESGNVSCTPRSSPSWSVLTLVIVAGANMSDIRFPHLKTASTEKTLTSASSTDFSTGGPVRLVELMNYKHFVLASNLYQTQRSVSCGY